MQTHELRDKGIDRELYGPERKGVGVRSGKDGGQRGRWGQVPAERATPGTVAAAG